MAGHSKWANIKFRKAGQDAKRGKLFTKLIREITVATKAGGAELNNNPRLRRAVDNALSANMSKDTIERAIKKGSGAGSDSSLEEVRYEGYAVGGIAVIVDCLTDNKNRTVGEVRHAFSKHGGSLGTSGSVSYMFNKTGVITLEKVENEDSVIELAIDNGATDVEVLDDDTIEILVEFSSINDLEKVLLEKNIKILNSEIAMLAATKTKVEASQEEQVQKLIDTLEDLDDVQEVYTNIE